MISTTAYFLVFSVRGRLRNATAQTEPITGYSEVKRVEKELSDRFGIPDITLISWAKYDRG